VTHCATFGSETATRSSQYYLTGIVHVGFSVAHTVNEVYVPSKVDLETGEVQNSMHELHHFRWVSVNLLLQNWYVI